MPLAWKKKKRAFEFCIHSPTVCSTLNWREFRSQTKYFNILYILINKKNVTRYFIFSRGDFQKAQKAVKTNSSNHLFFRISNLLDLSKHTNYKRSYFLWRKKSPSVWTFIFNRKIFSLYYFYFNDCLLQLAWLILFTIWNTRVFWEAKKESRRAPASCIMRCGTWFWQLWACCPPMKLSLIHVVPLPLPLH